MYKIDMQEMSKEFFPCWQAAGYHLDMKGQPFFWLKADPSPPYLEHFSFRKGNQLFFIRVIDAEGKIYGPGTLQGLSMIAEGCKGHACLLPMKKFATNGLWKPIVPGWGLIDAETKKPVDPSLLVSDEKIEMTPWEVHDMAVQVVRDYLTERGYKLMSAQGNPHVDPSIWFIGDSKKPEWVVVRSAVYPESKAERPKTWNAILNQCSHMSDIGHFASVALSSISQPFSSTNESVVPLWRGVGMHVSFSGLE